MAMNPGTAQTAPKGRATRAQSSEIEQGPRLSPNTQWALVALAGLAIVAGIFYFGRNVSSNLGGGHGGGQSGAPAQVEYIDPIAL